MAERPGQATTLIVLTSQNAEFIKISPHGINYFALLIVWTSCSSQYSRGLCHFHLFIRARLLEKHPIQALLRHEALVHYLPDTGNGSIHVPLGGKAPQTYAYCPGRCLLIESNRTQYMRRRARP
jgi:hypothetical protein